MSDNEPVDVDASIEGGNYEVIRKRLLRGGQALRAKTEALNESRTAAFGSTELAVTANGRVRTEHNCVPRDIVQVEGHLLLGFNVKMGLKKEAGVADVFSLHDMTDHQDGSDFPHVTEGGSFLRDPGFEKDFGDLYRYYRGSELAQLRLTDTLLLAIFRIGDSEHDLKVIRWRLESDGSIGYVDNRGERDHIRPVSHDFEWQRAGRDNQVIGDHPHMNILDTVFVETVGGKLTIKIEDNTNDGQGIYNEPVDDKNQTLDDADFHYAQLGALLLLKIRPYRESTDRYFVYNTRAHTVQRIDAIGQACMQLPEDHGILFPGGFALQTGEHKIFDDSAGMEFEKVIRAPNGEDVLYIFHRTSDGHYMLLPYNLIRKEVANVIHCHGYSLFEDGRMVIFRSVNDEPTRVHPMQVWQTPFVSNEFAANAPTDDSFLAKIGNAELVRGISDALSVCRLIENSQPSRQIYEDLINALSRMSDAYYWLERAEVGDLKTTLGEVTRTTELIVDEFEKVISLRNQAAGQLTECQERQREVVEGVRSYSLTSVEDFMEAMTAIRQQRGHLITTRDVRFIDTAAIDALEAEAVAKFEEVSQACVEFLLGDKALTPLRNDIEGLLAQIETTDKVAEIEPLRERMQVLSEGLDLLTEVVAGIQVDDVTQRTQILEDISEIFGALNRVRATLDGRRKELMGSEGRAEFGAQFKLFGQSVSSAISLCDTPEKCDDEQSRLMISLQELEAKFSEFDEFLGDLTAKREEVYEAFSARKQTLLDERQRRVGNVLKAGDRILEGVTRRAKTFKSQDDLNAWFASDPMVLKLRDLADQLAGMGDSVKSEELHSRLKSSRQTALRGLRDRLDLFDEGSENLIKFGTHRFTVNTQPFELTMVPRDDAMMLHLTGTDFYQPVTDEAFLETRPFWPQTVVSENKGVYRAEYLAATMLFAAERGENGLSQAGLAEAAREGTLIDLVKARAQARYDEGYERGLHDADATLLLEQLVKMRAAAGLLRFGPAPRAVAALFWGRFTDTEQKSTWQRKARSLIQLRTLFGPSSALNELADALGGAIATLIDDVNLPELRPHTTLAGRYLLEELGSERPRFTTSREAEQIKDAVYTTLENSDLRRQFDEDLRGLKGDLAGRLSVVRAWVEAISARDEAHASDPELILEATVIIGGDQVDREVSSAVTRVEVTGLLGQHPCIQSRKMLLRLDDFLGRLTDFIENTVPGYRQYRERRQALVERTKATLRLDEFMPKVMSAFVRNQLISDVYLPMIGDNLAKQMGAAGDNKRTDQMGLLLLISPPGYGKTTLMEYIANRLGLVFVKVNGPALGHSVHSLDPAEAPNATARQEVEKINFALEMSNNVMLYLDDIQHTHPELLQKFISLCDAQRKIEGVWKGKTRTYDMKGKKFCVIMAGNPYTESGDKFQIPDMLANRADTYNLGDILEGRDQVFALSYIENALTSNATLAPLATREQADIYTLIKIAQGEDIPTSELKHGYSAVEISEITAVLQRMFTVQDLVLKVNLQYIESASQDDKFRTEPPFKLQGSYRNMAKLAEKVVSAMNEVEVQALLDDHYNGESQTLTTGAEQNLLKLAEMRGRLTEEQAVRWEQIKRDFRRLSSMGGDADDPISRVTSTIASLGSQVEGIREALSAGDSMAQIAGSLDGIRGALGEAPDLNLTPIAQALTGIQSRLGESPDLDLAPLTQALAGIQAALASGSSDSMQHIASGLVGIRGALATGSTAPGLQAISKQIEALTKALNQRPAGVPARPRVVQTGDIDTTQKMPAINLDPAPVAVDGRMETLISQLNATLQRVARPQIELTVHTPKAVEELLGQQVQIVERTLVPLVQATTKNMHDAQALGAHLTQLIALLKTIDAKLG